MRSKFVMYLFVALGLLLGIFALSPPTPAYADEGFLFPYADGTYALTQECHPDAWGNFVGVASTCAIDFTAKICGAEAKAPVSGDLYSYADDGLGLGNTAGILDGDRFRIFFLHGDFVASTHLNQGDVFGREASHGNSSGCHWHMTVFDKSLNQWVNPLTLQPVGDISSGQVAELVPRPPGELILMLKNIKIVVSSTVVEVASPTPTVAVLQPTLQPKIIAVEVMNPQNPTVIRFFITWGFIVGLLIASGATAFGTKPTKATGIVLLIALAVIGYWFLGQGFRPVFELTTTAAEPTSPPPTMDRQVEEVVVTNVVLTRLPGSVASQDPPTSGECRIDPKWPQSIQQWCPWVTKYAVANGVEPDWVAAMMWQESRGNPSASSSAGAVGLIQVMPSNGYIGINDEAGRAAYRNRFGLLFSSRPSVEQLLNPEFNLAYGVGYLGGLFYKYGSMWEALLHYGGPGYGDAYRGAVKAHYDCVVLNQTGICGPGLIP